MNTPDNRRTDPYRRLALARRQLVALVAIWLVTLAAAIAFGTLVLWLFVVVLAPLVAWLATQVRRRGRELGR